MLYFCTRKKCTKLIAYFKVQKYSMKKIKFLSLTLGALLWSVSLSAQFIAQMALATPHYYPGEVYFVDGHYEEYDEVELPRGGKSKLAVKKHSTDKSRTEIEAIDILGIKIWHKDFPDKTHTLHYVHSQKAMMQGEHHWGNIVAMSDWGVVFQCEVYYQIDKKTGDLYFVKIEGGTGPGTPTLFYLKRPDWDLAQLVIIGGIFAGKKKVAELFGENATIAEGIKKGKLKATDIQYILDEMAGGKKAETQAEEPVEELQESASNGVVGDDE